MRNALIVVVVLCCLLSLAQNPPAQPQSNGRKRPFTFEDMMQLKRINEPVPSPDGKWVAFSAVDVNLEDNTKKPHLWIVPIAGGEAQRLLQTTSGEDRPRFSPDGKRLAFLSARDGGNQVYVADFDNTRGILVGEPRKVTDVSTEADGEIWTPDGHNIVFTSSVWPDCKDDACNKQRDEDRAKSRVKASVFTHLFLKHWTQFQYGKRTHIFVVSVDADASSVIHAARDLTPGDHDAPPFSLGGQDMYAVSPDSQELAFTSNITEHDAWSTNNDIFVLPLAGGTPKKISTSPGSDSTPLYSPDGKYIAWHMQQRDGYESDKFNLVIFERASGKITNLTQNFDRWVGSFVWSPDSKTIYFSAEDKGESPIYSLAASGGSAQEIIGGHNDDLAVTPDGNTLLFTRMTAQAPNEIYAAPPLVPAATPTKTTAQIGVAKVNVSAVAGVPVTHLNDSVLSQVSTSPAEPFWFEGAKKAKVQGFLVKPPNFDPKQKYPVKFLMHGGPEGAWGDSWTYRWNAQLFAANGYVVVMVNPRGSTGYGQKFTEDIIGDWGGKPYEDLMKGLDYAIKTYPFIDGERVCAMGASYGGYMANWIETHSTRFKCVVSHDGMFNTESAYGSTEELWFPEFEFKGVPWKSREVYRKWSPHLFIQNAKTPMLVVHSQLDYRLDVSEGEQLFTSLQRLGVPSKFLYFPDEGHWILKPQNSQLWYKTVNDWVDQWVKQPAK
jgi:dipeptidyl aminopeptidase/acylaminoacyl peptidase